MTHTPLLPSTPDAKHKDVIAERSAESDPSLQTVTALEQHLLSAYPEFF